MLVTIAFLSLGPARASAQQCVKCGDVNGDGQADIVDGLFIGQHTVDLRPVLACSVQSDVDGVGGIDIVDALFIAQFTVGFRTKLRCPLGDTEPPALSITSPAAGTSIFQNRPPIDITYDDNNAIDTASLGLSANGQAIQVGCQLSNTGAQCTPTTALPEGLIDLVASVKDVAGNPASATLSFTVDSVPVAVSIAAPTSGLITRDADIQVSGTTGAGVSAVSVNGVAATLSGSSFSATVPLREGINMLVAVATKANGKTGTDSIDVTRDLTAPIVRIDSPRDHFVSLNDTISVTGLVNDTVSGSAIPAVTVNGAQATVAGGAFMVMDLPLVRGPNVIEAVGTDAVGNTGRHTITVTFQEAIGARITLASGNGQVGAVMQALPQPLVATIKDDLGNPVAGRVVRFEVTRNSGTLKLGVAGPPERIVQVPTDGSGQAAALFTLGDTAGEGNNRVLATALGVAGEVEFCASAQAVAPEQILMVNGDNQRGAISHPLATPLEALVIDMNGNPLQGVAVTFAVVKGGGHLNGAQSLVQATGTNGVARAVLTLGPDPGVNNNVVNATFAGLASLPATFVASGLVPGDPAATRFAGVVLDNAHTPIPGALVAIPGTTVSGVTDAQGQFLLENVPVGHINPHIDASTSTRPETFPQLAFETVTVAGQINTLGQPILIPAIDTDNSKIVGGSQDVTLTMKGVAGLTLTVFANSATFPNASPTGRLTISQVHLDKVPMPPPSGTIFMPPAWTIQPAGTRFNPPARISIPNDGLPPGRVIDIFQFDHDLNMFINVGKGTVSQDGAVITSDPGFGITRAGWGGCGQPQPPQTCASSCDDGNRCTDDSCQNGSCVHTPKTTPQTVANMCEGCNNGTPVPKKTAGQCCAEKSLNAGGWVVCCNGIHTACTNPAGLGGSAVLVQCAKEHEQRHFQDNTACPTGPDECKTSGPLSTPTEEIRRDSECEASKVEVACLERANCGRTCQDRIVQMKQYGNTNKPGCFP